MASATMSILGLYQYDNTIFNNMVYPNEMTTEEKTNIVNNILLECSELECLYTDPGFMKWAIGVWSIKELPTWQRIYDASQLEYNPIENYDRMEDITDTTENTTEHSGRDVNTASGSDVRGVESEETVTNSGQDVISKTGNDVNTVTTSTDETVTDSGTDTTTNSIAGYDTTTLVVHDTSGLAHGKVVTTDNDGTKTESMRYGNSEQTVHGHEVETDNDITETVQYGKVDTFAHGEKIESSNEVVHEGRIHGNIGVTTSQQMLTQELEVTPKLNVANYIIDSFRKRFCILVY